MPLEIDLQPAASNVAIPGESLFHRWVAAALEGRRADAELAVRIVDEAEGLELNSRYRGRDYATNVLSFPVELPEGVDLPMLGDLVICAAVVNREAQEQGKSSEAHWAHMVVHGVLHLLGYDHQRDDEAEVMENIEREIMARLGYPDPYAEDRLGG
jgi:probable rRNA maturation factor